MIPVTGGHLSVLCAWIVAMHDASPSLSAAQDFSASQIGWHVFLASLVVLVFLRPPGSTAPPAHLNLRIFVLGVCIGGLALYLTSHLAASLAVSIAIWVPRPISLWRQRRAEALALQGRPRNPLQPAAQECAPIGSRPGVAFARAWFNAWINAHFRIFMVIVNAVDRFNERLFSLFIQLAIMRARSRESVHEAVARCDVRKAEQLVEKLVSPDAAGLASHLDKRL